MEEESNFPHGLTVNCRIGGFSRASVSWFQALCHAGHTHPLACVKSGFDTDHWIFPRVLTQQVLGGVWEFSFLVSYQNCWHRKPLAHTIHFTHIPGVYLLHSVFSSLFYSKSSLEQGGSNLLLCPGQGETKRATSRGAPIFCMLGENPIQGHIRIGCI